MIQFLPIVGTIIDKVLNVIDKSVEDKDLKEKLKTEIQLTIFTKEYDVIIKQLEAQRDIIVAEAKAESTLTRVWRPLLMLLFGLIIFNNYVINPYINVLFGVNIQLPIPPDMWDLLKLGISGYVISRGCEKVVREWKKNKNT